MGAAIAVALAVAAASAAVLTLAIKALGAERRAGDQKARADALDVNLTGLAAQLAEMTNRHREEKQRADGLDDLFAQVLTRAAGPARGSYELLLAEVRAYYAKRGDGARAVHPSASPGTPGPDDLLDPYADH